MLVCCACLNSHSTMSSSVTHVVACVRIAFFLRLSSIPVRVHVRVSVCVCPVLFTHLSTDTGAVSAFWYWEQCFCEHRHTNTCWSPCSHPFGFILGAELFIHTTILCCVYWSHHSALHSSFTRVSFPLAMHRDPNFSMASPTLIMGGRGREF